MARRITSVLTSISSGGLTTQGFKDLVYKHLPEVLELFWSVAVSCRTILHDPGGARARSGLATTEGNAREMRRGAHLEQLWG